MKSTLTMESFTTIPTRITAPMRLIVLMPPPVKRRAMTAPTTARGTAMRIVNGWTNDSNWAARIMYTRRRASPKAKDGVLQRLALGTSLELALAEAPAGRPKEIVKEGLSEYFIYTIEGTETVNNGWSKRMRSLKPVRVPLKIQYRYREPEYGQQLVRMYLMCNDVESKLGTTPLPDGAVRVRGS